MKEKNGRANTPAGKHGAGQKKACAYQNGKRQSAGIGFHTVPLSTFLVIPTRYAVTGFSMTDCQLNGQIIGGEKNATEKFFCCLPSDRNPFSHAFPEQYRWEATGFEWAPRVNPGPRGWAVLHGDHSGPWVRFPARTTRFRSVPRTRDPRKTRSGVSRSRGRTSFVSTHHCFQKPTGAVGLHSPSQK